MPRVILVIECLQTDRDGEVLHYEVQVGSMLKVNGQFVHRTASPTYERVIAEFPAGWMLNTRPTLLTPDARMSVRVEA